MCRRHFKLGTLFEWRRHFDGEDILSDGLFLRAGDILVAKSFWVADKFYVVITF